MDRVGGAEALLVVGIAALGRELLVLRAIQVVELAGNGVAGDELRLLDERFEGNPSTNGV